MLVPIFAFGTAFYLLFILLVCAALWKQKVPRDGDSKGISVIIAARNEEINLPRLLKSLSALVYPQNLYEIIIINDHSTDASMRILAEYNGKHNIRLIDFQDSLPGLTGKKAAIMNGINAARYDILAFTDADCVVPPSWLSRINSSMDNETDYLLGFSIMKRNPGAGSMRLRNFERGVYYALAAAGLYWRLPVTSSACNMVYRKSLFDQAGGFNGIGHLASGDDDLLLMKMMKYIRKACFDPSPEMQVVSIEGTDLAKRHQTNIRRASKFFHHPWWVKALSVFIFLYFLLFYLLVIRSLLGGFTFLAAYSLISKTIAEICLILLHFSKIRHIKLSVLYPLQLLLFPAQFLFYAVRGTLGGYRWK
ncbi:MAG: glycosyltransferase [Candidatus Cloacimonadaceae bacterium]|nr:glycosyltransferase [Candidatus Cloacimonadaceae bacterium]MDP3114758.1 glycosyltransferase [Candidatus Cloacimonadaceae bacterium]